MSKGNFVTMMVNVHLVSIMWTKNIKRLCKRKLSGQEMLSIDTNKMCNEHEVNCSPKMNDRHIRLAIQSFRNCGFRTQHTCVESMIEKGGGRFLSEWMNMVHQQLSVYLCEGVTSNGSGVVLIEVRLWSGIWSRLDKGFKAACQTSDSRVEMIV